MAFSAYGLIRRAAWISCWALLGVSCSSHRIGQATVEVDEFPIELQWVTNSAEYRAICLQTFALAERRLREVVAGRPPGTWAVALDADETILDNSPYQEMLSETGKAYTRENWNAWVLLEVAGAVPGTKDFLERIHELGGRIAVVTNRRTAVCGATKSNLEALDLPFDLILCRSDEGSKERRWKSIEEGEAGSDLGPLEIVMWLGDNIEDFPGWDQSRRGEPKESFGDFGSRFFVLPNPLYGSFEDNPR